MLCIQEGDIFDWKESHTILIPVNCIGIMGKGLALIFKTKYPELFYEYNMMCRRKEIQLGKGMRSQKDPSVYYFPTKGHWKETSNLVDIYQGLIQLAHEIKTPIASPYLGCGLGELNGKDLEDLLIEIQGEFSEFRLIHPPKKKK